MVGFGAVPLSTSVVTAEFRSDISAAATSLAGDKAIPCRECGLTLVRLLHPITCSTDLVNKSIPSGALSRARRLRYAGAGGNTMLHTATAAAHAARLQGNH
jgi:hypothetical protein